MSINSFLSGLARYVDNGFSRAYKEYKLSKVMGRLILLSPAFLILLYFVLLVIPATRGLALWTLEENHPVEMLTFIFLFIGAINGFALSYKAKRSSEKAFIVGFYRIFACGMLIVALEEIAWGQAIFGFETPEFWKLINVQKETTLHNISGLQGHSEIFRLAFGLGGLIGLSIVRCDAYRKISTPSLLLFWLIIITTHATIDLYNDYFPIQGQFDSLMQRTSELIEFMIGVSAFLYIYLNNRLLSGDRQAAVSGNQR